MLPKKLSFLYHCLLICFIGMLVSCKKEITTDQLLSKSIKAHGGIETWESIQEISYSKRTVLYDSLGTIESDQTKIHTYNFSPDFTATMTWEQDSLNYSVISSEEKTNVFLNDSLLTDAALITKYEKEVQGAYYVYWMPYKLLDENAELQYDGLEPWNSTGMAHKLQVSYPDAWDTWWYYFDSETFKLVGTKVYHEPTYSFIKNTKYEAQTGLSLNAESSSYRVNDNDVVQFKRADYFYEVLKVK